ILYCCFVKMIFFLSVFKRIYNVLPKLAMALMHKLARTQFTRKKDLCGMPFFKITPVCDRKVNRDKSTGRYIRNSYIAISVYKIGNRMVVPKKHSMSILIVYFFYNTNKVVS